MSERRDSLRLPLKNHNYLRQIAWTIADQDDAKAEAGRNEREATGNHRRPSGQGEGDGLSQIERAILAKTVAPHPALSREGERGLKRMED